MILGSKVTPGLLFKLLQRCITGKTLECYSHSLTESNLGLPGCKQRASK